MKFRKHLLCSPAGEGTGGGDGGSSQVDGGQKGEGGKAEGEGSGSAGAKGGEQKDSGKADGELDVASLDPKVQKLIKDLRKENAEARKKNGSLSESHDKLKKALVEAGIIEDDEGTPEEKLKSVAERSEQLAFNSAILEAAVEHEVSKSDLSFFRYLVTEKVGELEDGAELTEEDLAELAKQAKRSQPSNPGATTSPSGATAPRPGGSGAVTLEQFVKMNMGEKTTLYTKDKDTYVRLMTEARAKKMIF